VFPKLAFKLTIKKSARKLFRASVFNVDEEAVLPAFYGHPLKARAGELGIFHLHRTDMSKRRAG
jgi:hypothetical protein